MRDDFVLDRRRLTPIILASLAALALILIAFARLDGFTGDAAQPTPCPDSIACRALKRYDAMRAAETPQP
ncbi:MAG: hypothetical protein RMN52_14585 [Anaerolineae bacterium]|nr:hypothetical protein [Candidatus Roseilinea sp.]MDW8451224.1 hypothetical protein [Anaerolineae bacterium]